MRQRTLAAFCTVTLATAALASAPAAAAGTGAAIQGHVSGTTDAPVAGPETGPNGTAIPEVPSTGAPRGEPMHDDTNHDETTGSVGSDKGDASASALQQRLTGLGYTHVWPQNPSETGGETRFEAVNPNGKRVIVTMDAQSGTVQSERPAD